jgi:hypothetical protein
MSCGICVDLEVVGSCWRSFSCGLEYRGAEQHGLFMSGLEVIDAQINVDLLRRSVWPLWRDMVR